MLPSSSQLILALGVLFTLFGCTKKTDVINLDHYGAFKNTEFNIAIAGAVDSCSVHMNNYQELYGGMKFDTMLDLHNDRVKIRKTLTLERPSIVLLNINNQEKEIFLIPTFNNNLLVQIDSSDMTLTFEDSDLQKINLYYNQKAMLGGDMYMRSLMTSVMSLPTMPQVFDSLDAVKSSLDQLLYETDLSQDLPTWFIRFEEKNIAYFCLTMKAGAPRVRRVLFGMKDTLQEEFNIQNLGFELNDELALTTQHYMSSLPKFIAIGPDSLDMYEMDPVSRLNLFYQKSELILNGRIRDVYRSHLFFTMLRTSHYFPDTLISKVRNSISADLQPYLDRIEKKYKQFNGLPAPAIHLLDSNDSLVSLKDFQGNLILLDFWFVGCPFCKLENPFTKALTEEFQDKNFKVLQICMKSDREAWEKLKGDFVGIPLYSNEHWDKKLEYSYKISGYPRYVLIDENGIVLEGWCEKPSDPALKQRISDHFESKKQSGKG